MAADIRPVGSADLDALTIEVARARAAGEFRASSDPEGTWFLEALRRTPSPTAAAFDADGAVVGFVSPEFKLLVVRPSDRRRGIGRALVEAGVTIERGRGRPNVLLGVMPGDTIGEAFVRATGFAPHSTLWDLSLPPQVPVPQPAWPDGLVARPFSRDRDIRSWGELLNLAFADHPTPFRMDIDAEEAAPADPAVADDDILLIEDSATGALVGFCATTADRIEGRTGPGAEIWAIGVAPERQGRGLGRQLLRWGSLRLRGLDAGEVHLSVNGRNEGALGLYEREGFAPWRTRERWALPVAGEASAG